MATFETNRPIVGTTFFGAPVRLVTNLHGQIADWLDRRATAKALDSLSDRELDDIGLSRGDIEQRR
ncbi:MAG: hypothetical protein ACJA1E_000822 [Paracoccaceae bacterium]|jgi:uncharacterized protein YjiS (DUF1127 family)